MHPNRGGGTRLAVIGGDTRWDATSAWALRLPAALLVLLAATTWAGIVPFHFAFRVDRLDRGWQRCIVLARQLPLMLSLTISTTVKPLI